jgi:hypothetical protein
LFQNHSAFKNSEGNQEMGEIKSTLDLVLEKTKHLTLSPEEKQKQDLTEAKKAIKSLLQKYQDDLLSFEQLEDKLHRLQETSSMDGAWMRNIVSERIDPDQDNTIWLELLDKYFGLNITGLASVLHEYRRALNQAEEKWCNKQKETLETDHSIKGSAVVPNPDSDPHWVSERKGIQKNFQKRLDDLKQSA